MRWPWGRGERLELEEATNPVPSVEPAADAYSVLGLWQPVGVGVASAVAFAVADLLGAVSLGDVRWQSVGVAGLGAVGAAVVGFTRGRDHLHDRMRLAKPVPDRTEVNDDAGDRVIAGLVPVGLYGTLVLGGTEAAHLLRGDEAHWFLLLTVIGLGMSLNEAAGALAVRAEERARGVRFFRIEDRDQYESVSGEDLSESDPGPMFIER